MKNSDLFSEIAALAGVEYACRQCKGGIELHTCEKCAVNNCGDIIKFHAWIGERRLLSQANANRMPSVESGHIPVRTISGANVAFT